MKTIIIIPSRLQATRLPGKPLLKINNLSIISHVFRQAQKSNIGEAIVATEDQEIIDDVTKNGGNAILTSKNHKTGTDRIYEAFQKMNIKDVDLIMNLQGDEPAINVEDIVNLNKKMIKNHSQIGTLAAVIKDSSDLENENIVKVITEKSLQEDYFPRAVSFLRKSENTKNIYHHIGIYIFNVSYLEKFVQLEQTQNEKSQNLEQLRLMDNNIEIDVGLAKTKPIGVDTDEDYLEIKKIMEYKN